MKRDEWYYTGLSMASILKAGEILDVEPYGGKEVRRGDVIVFNPPGKNKTIIHRVVSTCGGEIRARGDNNREIDPWIISREHIVGKVTHARGRSRRRITGGTRGHIHAQAVRYLRRGACMLKGIVRPAYRRLAATGTVKRLLPLERKLRVISISRASGHEHKLLLGKNVIGIRKPHAAQWQIRHPFRLFIDQAALPGQIPVDASIPLNKK